MKFNKMNDFFYEERNFYEQLIMKTILAPTIAFIFT